MGEVDAMLDWANMRLKTINERLEELKDEERRTLELIIELRALEQDRTVEQAKIGKERCCPKSPRIRTPAEGT